MMVIFSHEKIVENGTDPEIKIESTPRHECHDSTEK